MKTSSFVLIVALAFLSCTEEYANHVGNTSIAKWKDNKKTAISVTYDDGIITQFTVAKPIMDSYKIPGTFYIITGKVEGAQKGKFIGRDKEDIINETSRIKTNKDNFFERASLIAFTGTSEAVDYHSRAGSLFERGELAKAYALIDEGFEKIRKGTIKDWDKVVFHDNDVDTTTWEDFKNYAKQGHEIASHTVTHPRLAVLDEVNMLYELKQSRKDVAQFLGLNATYSAECPYGTEDERVMEYAHKIYPALRNRMPEPYLEELNRANTKEPGLSVKEYVQWQRGPLSKHSVAEMKSWIDTCIVHDNIWLVLVFHGVDDYGWEPKTGEELEEYFSYMNDLREDIWIATFADVTKYLRERKSTRIKSMVHKSNINIELTSTLDRDVYYIPLTLKTYLPDSWSNVSIIQALNKSEIQSDSIGNFINYNVHPYIQEININKID